MELEFWQAVFAPDKGTLLNIRIYGTDRSDYGIFLKLIKSQYSVVYSEDGTNKSLLSYEEIVEKTRTCSVRLTVDVRTVAVNCFFWDENEITLDLLPEDVDSWSKAEGVFVLMKAMASHLRKPVLLTAENGSATQRWSEQHAICVADPITHEISFRLD